MIGITVSISNPPSAQAFDTIADVLLSAPAATFGAISVGTGYKYLEILMILQSASTGGAMIRFNSDSGANYNNHQHYGSATSTAAAQQAAATSGFLGDFIANVPTIYKIIINNGTTLVKGFQSVSNAYNKTNNCSGYWNNTNEISAFAITASYDFIAGSRMIVRGYR